MNIEDSQLTMRRIETVNSAIRLWWVEVVYNGHRYLYASGPRNLAVEIWDNTVRVYHEAALCIGTTNIELPEGLDEEEQMCRAEQFVDEYLKSQERMQ